MGLVGRHAHVAEIVESEFTVRSVGDVAFILGAPRGRIHFILDAADGQPEIAEDGSHPLGVAPGEIVVDGDQLAVLSGQGVEVKRKDRDEGFSFTGRHFRDFSLMQHDAADHLHVEGNHVPDEFMIADRDGGSAESAAGVLDDGEGLAHDVVGRFAFLQTLLELLRLGLEFLLGKLLVGNFELVYFTDQLAQPFHIAAGLAAEHRFQNLSQHGKKYRLPEMVL